MAKLRAAKLCKGWDFPVLDEVELDIAEGEFFVLIGPSGAGKTTLLRLLAGLETPDAGKVFFDDIDVTSVPPYRRGAAMTFESYALYPQLSVFENIASPLRARNLSFDQIKEQVEKIAKLLRIDDLLERRPGEISGGQKQRTALGRTLVATPQIFLLDEPLSHLDARIRIELREQFHTLAELRRTATLYVTHDYAEALSLGDRVGVLSDGDIIQIGTPEEVFRNPASVTVAKQFGQPGINLLEVEFGGQDDELVARAGQLELLVAAKHRPSLAKINGAAQLGIRPQDMRIDVPDGIEGRVVAFQSLGSYGVCSVNCAGVQLQVIAAAETLAKPGDQVRVQIDKEAFMWFDGAGNALGAKL